MSNIIKIVEEELDKLQAFSGKRNSVTNTMVKILDDDIPMKMRVSIANYIMSSFVMHFKTKIELGDGTLVPTNIINFILASSGVKKTSSVNLLEKSMSQGYEAIQAYRTTKMEKRAEELAEANDDDNVAKYMKRLNPLFNTLSTEQGMIKKLNDFAEEGVGTPSLFVDEISTELEVNPDIIPNIKLVSQLFDLGNMKSKALKDESNQSQEVVGQAMACLFIGSEAGILLEEKILKKFTTEFISKLARRCFFSFPEFPYIEKSVTSIDDLLKGVQDKKKASLVFRQEINNISLEISNKLLLNDINTIPMSEKAIRLYDVYKIWCEEVSKELEGVEELEFQHRHWKALKLAGVYSVFNNHMFLEPEDLVEAITVAQDNRHDLSKFMEFAKREDYEVMIDALRLTTRFSYHELSKHNWISNRGKPETQTDSLVKLANSKLGKEGVVKHEDGFVWLETFKQVDSHGASYKLVSGTKEERSYQARDGYKFQETSFEKLGNLLSNDTCYLAFDLKNGSRSNDNIDSGATFVVLDIDDSDITWTEAHDTLQDYKHLVAQTSNPDNPYKFRMIFELDVEVNLASTQWKNFMSKVGEHLGLSLDLLPQSQMYFGFKGREVLKQLDGDRLPASEFIKNLDAPVEKPQKLSSVKIDSAYKDRLSLFEYAYEYSGDWGGATNFRMVKHAYDLGFSEQRVYDLVEDVCDYRDIDLDAFYKRTSLKNQIVRMYKGKL